VGAQGAVFGVDISAGMLAQARLRLEKDDPRSPFNLAQGDGTRLPFQSASLDALFLSFTLELFDTPEIAPLLDECRRVMKTGGRIGVVSLALGEKPRWTVKVYEWFHARFPNGVDCRPIHARLALQANDFEVLDYQMRQLWGLPVEIVVART
jgi:ubiquinone/menaquinone biosynthesis C-methylase UbiE